ncbi:MAG TPA: mechanosensitive ion channel domain-containing protein [Verrucomicrobiae bacterium]|nr:mechanosensitive ion channel domain-containing protein [Verrucomicrobiae bacterium]
MFGVLLIAATSKTLQQSSNVLKQIANTVFGGNSLMVLLLSLLTAVILGRISTTILRGLSRGFGRQADAATDLNAVNRYRRLETWTILLIALMRVVIFVLALYFWWVYTHPGNRPGALIGASALLAVIIGGVFSPLLRDFAFGGGMMAEHWFGVGDLITIEPFTGIQGVVERITLRSTRIRGLNGEVIWIANQNISGVRIAQKGVWTMAVELFVTDPKKAELLIEQANDLLPSGPALLASPLRTMTTAKRGDKLWHITAIGEIAPGREWLIERTAIDLLKRLDEKSKTQVLVTDPIARYADNDTERQFARAVKNAKKTKRKPRRKLTTEQPEK